MGDDLPNVDLGDGKYARSVGIGQDHRCAVLTDGNLKCWGRGDSGRLGYGDTSNRGDNPNEMGNNLPNVNLGTGKSAIQVVAGYSHTCALLNDKNVKCWGCLWYACGYQNSIGWGPNQMGDNLNITNLGTGKTVVQITSGQNHVCAILNDGNVKCWGYNDKGQLGYGDTNSRGLNSNEMGDNLTAVNLGTGKTAVQVAAGGDLTCVILNDGNVKCWGDGVFALGYGDEVQRNVPGPNVDLGTGKTAVQIGTNGRFTCVLLNDGNIKCWGQSSAGGGKMYGNGPTKMGDNLPNWDLGFEKPSSTDPSKSPAPRLTHMSAAIYFVLSVLWLVL
eukprot:g12162.t1